MLPMASIWQFFFSTGKMSRSERWAKHPGENDDRPLISALLVLDTETMKKKSVISR